MGRRRRRVASHVLSLWREREREREREAAAQQ